METLIVIAEAATWMDVVKCGIGGLVAVAICWIFFR